MIYTLTLNPSLDHHLTTKRLIKDDIVHAENVRWDPGGKGLNVTRVIQELGGQSCAFGIMGGPSGKMLKEMLEGRRINHHFCQIPGNTRINCKITTGDGEHFQIQGPGPKLTVVDIKRVIALIENAKPRPSYWVLAGSLPPGVSANIYAKLVVHFQKRGEKCLIDSDGEPLKRAINAKPFLIKPNEFELERLIGRKLMTQNQVLAAARALTQKADIVAVTLGKKGALMVTSNDAWHLTAPSVKVKGPVGAGDAFLDGLIFALDNGEGLRDASRWAVAAAAASVMKEGTANGSRNEVKRLVKRIVLKNF